jgi:hypothetical protein
MVMIPAAGCTAAPTNRFRAAILPQLNSHAAAPSPGAGAPWLFAASARVPAHLPCVERAAAGPVPVLAVKDEGHHQAPCSERNQQRPGACGRRPGRVTLLPAALGSLLLGGRPQQQRQRREPRGGGEAASDLVAAERVRGYGIGRFEGGL